MTGPGHLHELYVELAGHAFLLRGDDPSWHHRALARYASFVSESGTNPFVIDVTTVAGTDPAAIVLERDTPPDSRWEAGRLVLRSRTYAADADLHARRATVKGPPLAYPVDALLRFLLAGLLDDGLLIHAALLVDGDRSWLATGPSGSGKSTLAALLPEHAAADELAAVRAADGDVIGHGLPFWLGRRVHARLAGIYLLRHGPRCRRVRLDPRAALRGLAPEVLWPLGPPGATDHGLALLQRIVARVPVWSLEFRPHPEVWDTMTRGNDA